MEVVRCRGLVGVAWILLRMNNAIDQSRIARLHSSLKMVESAPDCAVTLLTIRTSPLGTEWLNAQYYSGHDLGTPT